MRQKLTDAAIDAAASAWTWLGMTVAWVVLPDGGTRDFVGAAIAALIVAWVITGPLRWGKN
jgi:hypothetical protein